MTLIFFHNRCFCSETGRTVPKTFDEYRGLQSREVTQPPHPKLIRVSIIGCPNAGKSTLLNKLIKWKVSAVSSKVHTTRSNTIGVYNEDDTQIEFIDTPGLVSKRHITKHKLGSTFVSDIQFSLTNTDVIAIIVDSSNKYEQERLHLKILELLRRNRDKESLLILNKVDKIKQKRRLLEITNNLTTGLIDGKPFRKPDDLQLKMELKEGNFETLFHRTEHYLQYKDQGDDKEIELQESMIGWPNFSQVFMVSALYDDGINYLRSHLLQKATDRPWLYNENFVTPQKPEKLIIDCLRGVCFELFRQEIPYNIWFKIVMWEVDEIGNLFLVIDMHCPKKFLSYIIGPKGVNISTLVRKSRESLSDTFRCDVSLKIAAKYHINNK